MWWAGLKRREPLLCTSPSRLRGSEREYILQMEYFLRPAPTLFMSVREEFFSETERLHGFMATKPGGLADTTLEKSESVEHRPQGE
jgi:hypothetical protein